MLHVGRQVHFLGGGKGLVIRVLRELEPLEGEPVIDGHDLGEKRQGGIPVFEDLLGPVASGIFIMTLHQTAEERFVLDGGDTLDIHHIQVAAGVEKPGLVVHESDAAAHARGEVVAGFAEHDHDAAGHVFAAVVAQSLDHRDRAAVPHREPFSGDAVEEDLAAGRAVKDGISGDDILMRREPGAHRRDHHDASAGHALAEIIVGVPFQPQEDSRSEKRPETLARGPLQPDFDGAVRKPFSPYRRVTSPLTWVPTVRCTFRMAEENTTRSPRSRAGAAARAPPLPGRTVSSPRADSPSRMSSAGQSATL